NLGVRPVRQPEVGRSSGHFGLERWSGLQQLQPIIEHSHPQRHDGIAAGQAPATTTPVSAPANEPTPTLHRTTADGQMLLLIAGIFHRPAMVAQIAQNSARVCCPCPVENLK
ncbi:MAG: hypothetical protein NZ823_16245, partial [Blastocatellia bacterium]|nr:hypothetical protein [Blastocatellia bacterium]